MTILYCLIANILTIALIGGICYYFYKKNQETINNGLKKIKEIISTVDSASKDLTELKSKIESVLNKWPFA